MSQEQYDWLAATLARARTARHVFVFLHHPRWLSRYGDDWQKVHALLAKNGNVSAVFAGHIHHMRFDGVRDGIEYYTVASVGAHLGMDAPQAGFLHQFHVVTVRPEGIVVAALPVRTVMDRLVHHDEEVLVVIDEGLPVGIVTREQLLALVRCVSADMFTTTPEQNPHDTDFLVVPDVVATV